MPAVQFYGIEETMVAVQAMQCACWSIHINGKMFTKYEDTDIEESQEMLANALALLEKNGSNGIYTLNFFENEGKRRKIDQKTVVDAGSFMFKLLDQEERSNRAANYSNTTMLLEKRIAKLEAKKQDDDDDEPETIEEAVIGAIKNPDQLAQLVNIFRSVMGMPVQNFGIAGINKIDSKQQEETDESKLARVEAALNTLEKHDDNLINHLEKLAKIANENPTEFKKRISFINLL